MNPYTQQYRQQYNQSQDLIYQPEDNTDMINRYADLLNKKQDQYDTAVDNYSKMIGTIGGLKSYSPNLINDRVKSFSDAVRNVVENQYGGDWGAARHDVVNMIEDEKSNELYKYNDYLNEQAKIQDQFRVKYKDKYIAARDSSGNIIDLKNPQLLEKAIASEDPYGMLTARAYERPDYGNIASKYASQVPANTTEQLIVGLNESDKNKLRQLAGTDVKGFFRALSVTQNRDNLKNAVNEIEDLLYQDNKEVLNAEYGNEQSAREALRPIIESATGLYDFYKENEQLDDINKYLPKGGEQNSNFYSTISLPIENEDYKKANEEFNEINDFIEQQEPEEFFEQTIQGPSPGTKVNVKEKSLDRKNWEKTRDKINSEYESKVVPFAENSGLSNNKEWKNLSNAEKYLKYLNVKKNMSSYEEDINKISFESRTDLDKMVTQQQLAGINNFNIDGKDIGLDDFKKAIDAKGDSTDDIAKRMTIIGTDNIGRFVVQYNKETRRGIEPKYVRFYPSNESKVAFDPLNEVIKSFNVDNAKPMKLDNPDGDVWLVDYSYENGILMPRIIKGEKSDFINIKKDKDGKLINPKDVSNFIDNHRDYISDLKTMSDYIYSQYNKFYEDFIGKR